MGRVGSSKWMDCETQRGIWDMREDGDGGWGMVGFGGCFGES